MIPTCTRLFSIPEAREILGGIGHTTIYQLIKRGEITKVNLGRRGFVTSESIEAFLGRLAEASKTGAQACRGNTHFLDAQNVIDDDKASISGNAVKGSEVL